MQNVITGVITFYPPMEVGGHVIEGNRVVTDENGIQTTESIGKVVTTSGGVRLGKMSFKMLTDTFDISGFGLIPVNNTEGIVVQNAQPPLTGIKINLDAKYYFDQQSTFRFTDATASKDATLTNLIVSNKKENEDGNAPIYKEYTLDPNFAKETKKYQLELLEYLNTIDITATQSDQKATMEIKVPIHDSGGNLVYESDGTTIKYETKQLTNNIQMNVILNKLGEPDTKITIIVTAEDTTKKEEYELVIKRPYGTIKGSVNILETDSLGIHKSDIRLYKSDDTKATINWGGIVQGDADDVHDKLLALKSMDYVTKDDGTYEIYVVPGTYDVLLDKLGYLDHIYLKKEIKKGQTIDLGKKTLIAGDLNKDGQIQGKDLAMFLNVYLATDTDPNFDKACDFNEDKQIQGKDLAIFLSNYLEVRKIEN